MHGYSVKNELEFAEKFKDLSECDNVISEKTFFEADDEAMDKMINAYLDSACDMFTFYTREDEMRDYLNYINEAPSMKKCGFTVNVNSADQLYIDSITENSLAWNQGLRPNDVILAIDETVLAETGIYNNAEKICGKNETSVALKLKRNNETIELDFMRYTDTSESTIGVTSKKLENDIAYIKIENFNKFTSSKFNSELKNMGEYSSIIVDLRNNFGGDTEASIELSDYFIGEADVTMEYFTGERYVHKTTLDGNEIEKPVVILCNENSASSSEIVTGLLMQYKDNATVVGVNTIGKGCFQKDYVLSNGKLHYTAGYYTVGDWECYDGKGIAPDVEVKMDKELIGTDKDVQLQKAVEILSDTD